MTARKVTFPGHDGQMLAARLDMPVEKPRACALFAHCFSCSKDIAAARAIAQTLADIGIAVLRFDFTGLGHSKGEFANTNFSSNVDDLVAAADFMRTEIQAPSILIGHSLGGTAIIAASERIAESTAVVTIGAPSSPAHILKSLGSSLPAILQEGSAEVSLGGRPFTIKKQFVEDVSERTVQGTLGHLKKALLVLHAPLDKIVDIENASEIFGAAKHPKSFVSLDGADHLLSRVQDAEYVAEVIAAWAKRYIPPAKPGHSDQIPEGVVRVMRGDPDGLLQNISVGGQFHLIADEPLDVGGSNRGPSPYQLLSAALGACTLMTMSMYAKRKSISISALAVDVSHSKSYADDSAGAESASSKIDAFKRLITIEGDMTDAQRQRLLEIADLCPVHKTLSSRARIDTFLHEPSSVQ